jgi:hypothetical protein
MNISETIKTVLGVRQGSVEIHCHRGEPKNIHVHDKSIKFDETQRN